MKHLIEPRIWERYIEAAELKQRVRSFPQWSSDEALVFDGTTFGERLLDFGSKLGEQETISESVATISRATLYRLAYLAPRALTETETAFALVVLTGAFSQWLKVDWDETRYWAFSIEYVDIKAIYERGLQEGAAEGRKQELLGGELYNTHSELAEIIGSAVKAALIRGDEKPLALAAAELCRTALS